MAIYTAALLLVGVSKGYEDYLKNMPNQPITDAWQKHALGHINVVAGGGNNNAFGIAYAVTHSWSVALCNADSDGDGQSNGLELGDPCCVWNATSGAPFTSSQISNPADKNDFTSRKCPETCPSCSDNPGPAPPAPAPAAPAWAGLPNDLGVGSIATVVIAIALLFAAPALLAVCWAPQSYRVPLLVSLIAAVILVPAGTKGLLEWLESGYGGTPVSTAPYPFFTAPQYWGLVLAMIAMPLGALAIINFSLHFSKLGNGPVEERSTSSVRCVRQLWPRRFLQILALGGLALFFAWATAYAAFDFGWDIVRCGIIGCVVPGHPQTADASKATAFRNVAGVWLALHSVCLCAVHTLLALRCLMRAVAPGLYSAPSGNLLETIMKSNTLDVIPPRRGDTEGPGAALINPSDRSLSSSYSLNTGDMNRADLTPPKSMSSIDSLVHRTVYSRFFGPVNDGGLCGCCFGQYNGPIALILVFVILIPFIFICSMSLSDTWQAFTAASLPYTIATKASGEEHIGSFFKTFDIKTTWGKSIVYLKAYPDTIIFFTMIYVVSAFALLSRFIPGVRRLLRVKFQLPFVPKFRSLRIPVCKNMCLCCGRTDRSTGMHHIYPFSGNFFASTLVSVGQLCFIAIVSCFIVAWMIYWWHDHAFKGGDTIAIETFARTLGQLGNLVLGLVLLPVSRNSIWTHVFGIPWEASMGTHVFMGYAFLVIGVLHMFSWWITFYKIGGCDGHVDPPDCRKSSFPHDLYSVPSIYNGDNFTIPLIEFAFFLTLICMGIFAYERVRRKHFELFYWSHHIFLFLVPSVLLHAANAWIFVALGLFLWVVDRMVRINSASGAVHVLEVVAHEEHTSIKLVVEDGSRCPFAFLFSRVSFGCSGSGEGYGPIAHGAGQYCFINIPQISLLQWHPFSVSSSPYDKFSTFHIKGDGNFTEALHAFVKDAEVKHEQNRGPKPSELLTLSIDGAYGLPINHQQYKNVILFAGGIGVTPVHSTFRSLYHAAQRGLCKCEKVHLAWTARYTDIFKVGQEILLMALENPSPGDGFTTFTFECIVNDPWNTHPDTSPYTVSAPRHHLHLWASSDGEDGAAHIETEEVPYTTSKGYLDTVRCSCSFHVLPSSARATYFSLSFFLSFFLSLSFLAGCCDGQDCNAVRDARVGLDGAEAGARAGEDARLCMRSAWAVRCV